MLVAGSYPITLKWIDYVYFQSLDGTPQQRIEIEKCSVKDLQGGTTEFRFSPEKTYVLYFWTTRCGVCHSSFPAFKRLYDIYRSQPDIVFMAVNPTDMPEPESFITHQSDMTSLYVSSDLADRLRVRFYPTVTIIRGNRCVLFDNTRLAKKYLRKNRQ